MTYIWNGKTTSQIARIHGVTPEAVRKQARRYGHIDGLGQGGKGRKHGNAVSVGGRTWRTQRDFAAEVGRTEKHVSRVMNMGRFDLLERMLNRVTA